MGHPTVAARTRPSFPVWTLAERQQLAELLHSLEHGVSSPTGSDWRTILSCLFACQVRSCVVLAQGWTLCSRKSVESGRRRLDHHVCMKYVSPQLGPLNIPSSNTEADRKQSLAPLDKTSGTAKISNQPGQGLNHHPTKNEFRVCHSWFDRLVGSAWLACVRRVLAWSKEGESG